MLFENGVQAASGRVDFMLLPVPPTTIAGSGGDVFMSRHRLDTEKSVHLVTDVELAMVVLPERAECYHGKDVRIGNYVPGAKHDPTPVLLRPVPV